MSLKLATAVLMAVAVTSGPTRACMGPTVLFSENFLQADPTWGQLPDGTISISGGYAQITPAQGDWTFATYGGGFFDSADACVDILSPTVTNPSYGVAGLIFGLTSSSSSPTFYALVIEEDGYASVARFQNNGWLNPVPWGATPLVKQGANATNTLRVTWNGTSGTTYINGQVFSTFAIPQVFQNNEIGFYAAGDASTTAGATWKFTNLKVTNVAP